MSSVRASREGDQFHYSWAARQALRLLMTGTDFVALSIEGASGAEVGAEPKVVGEDLIDVAEYYGSTRLIDATLIKYIQLKHSTDQVDVAWPPSGLEKTISGFASRYRELLDRFPGAGIEDKVQFWFITNRPIHADFMEVVRSIASGKSTNDKTNVQKLQTYTSLKGEQLAAFCRMMFFEPSVDGYWNQRNILWQDLSGYLPAQDVDAPTRLTELVVRKALPESAHNPDITKYDVLRALQTSETQLYPAPNKINASTQLVVREQERDLVKSIVGNSAGPTLIYADGGVGKSVFATRIGTHLPAGSVTLVFDCFGNGSYRSASGYRHKHRVGFVQLANQLAAMGLCHPLIPTNLADNSDYVRAFINRISQAITILKARDKDALLCVVIDAADNAQVAADEVGDGNSFIKDLLRERLPDGSRLVVLCRGYRTHLLNPPPDTAYLELQAFSIDETRAHLLQKFPAATDHDIEEFHKLSSHNPRVQALALSREIALPEMLRELGPNPTTVESTIASILERAIARLKDEAGQLHQGQIDAICAGLACLRPLVPISILAQISGVSEMAIRSFVFDLGRPLVMNAEMIQFYDEPAESWFRDTFRPAKENVVRFLEKLKPLAVSSSYAAAALPYLMLEAEQFQELVILALNSEALPETSPVERRDIELQRLQFAIKASLRSKRFADAAKLALKAGGESAGEGRQRELLEENYDLASIFLGSAAAQNLVAIHNFGSSWLGSHHAFEAALFSWHPELIGEARSRLRMATEWLRNWADLTPEERKEEEISIADIAWMAMAHFHIHGSKEAANSLRHWKPRDISFRAGRLVASQLLDHGRYEDVDRLASEPASDVGLILALVVEARERHHNIPISAAERVFRVISDRRTDLDKLSEGMDPPIIAVLALAETLLLSEAGHESSVRALLEKYLSDTPSYSITSRHLRREHTPYLKAYALHAILSGRELTLVDIANKEQKIKLEDPKERNNHDQSMRRFMQAKRLLPWYILWAQCVVRKLMPEQIIEAVDSAREAYAKSSELYYQDFEIDDDDVASIWMETLILGGVADENAVREWADWTGEEKRRIFTPTYNRLSQLLGRTHEAKFAFEFARRSINLLTADRSDARSTVEGIAGVARSLFAISKPDAEVYFRQAIDESGKIGDENFARWEAIIDLAQRGAFSQSIDTEVVYRFARCAELSRSYVDREKHFSWNATLKALVQLSPASAIAIASRWRDRGFGSQDRILHQIIEEALERGHLAPIDALALLPFRSNWDAIALLTSAVNSASNESERLDVINFTYRYLCLSQHDSGVWLEFQKICVSNGVSIAGVDGFVKAANEVESKEKRSTYVPEEEETNWSEIFAGCGLSDTESIALAYSRFEKRKRHPVSLYLRQAVQRVPFGHEPKFIVALADVPAFDLFDFRSILEVLPPDWLLRPAIKEALQKMVKKLCHRFCMEIDRNRFFEPMPFKLLTEMSGWSETQLLEEISIGICHRQDILDARRLFSLAGMLAGLLEPESALEVMVYGLQLFDDELKDADGDGPWRSELKPPSDVSLALAGYVWAALAAPDSTLRWQAAHTVCAFYRFGRHKILTGLFDLDANGSSSPFVDGSLQFYRLHARQWLLLSSERAAHENGAQLLSYVTHFERYANLEEPHFMIRGIAARVLISLDLLGAIELDEQRRQKLRSLNRSPFEQVAYDREKILERRRQHAQDDKGKDEFSFGLDFGDKWLEPLGRRFGLTRQEMESEARQVVREVLGFAGKRGWEADERSQRRIFEYQDTEFRSSYPKVDDYSFYLMYHAMMITAGKLLATRPLVISEYDWESWQDWGRRHDITRTDGRWLFDRRDPPPPEIAIKPPPGETDVWWTSISSDDFDAILQPNNGWITVWGYWSIADSSRAQTIHVNSALVTKDRARSLQRALQTADNHHDYRIPPASDHLEINHNDFQLLGWISDSEHSNGIDQFDPWGGDVSFPPPGPADFVAAKLGLTPDPDRRVWQQMSTGQDVLKSDVWGELPQRHNEDHLPRGDRLQIAAPFLDELLSDMAMILKIEIQRNSRRYTYESGSEESTRKASTNVRIFVLNDGSSVRTQFGTYPLGEKIR
jgi:hypothetical protein